MRASDVTDMYDQQVVHNVTNFTVIRRVRERTGTVE